MIGSGSNALSGGSDEEARPPNAAGGQAAKRTKMPVVTPFGVMQERRMSSHRASAISAAASVAGTEGPAAEEPAEPEEPAEALQAMTSIERERQSKLKNATKTGGKGP